MPAKTHSLNKGYLLDIIKQWDSIEDLNDLSKQTHISINTIKSMNAGNKVSINSIEAVAKFLRINVLDFLLSKGLSVNVEAKTANLNILNNANNLIIDQKYKTIPLYLVSLENWREKFSSIINIIDINYTAPEVRWYLHTRMNSDLTRTLKELNTSIQNLRDYREDIAIESQRFGSEIREEMDFKNYSLNSQLIVTQTKYEAISNNLMIELFNNLKSSKLYMHFSEYYFWRLDIDAENIKDHSYTESRKYYSQLFNLLVISDSNHSSIGVDIGDSPQSELDDEVTYKDILDIFQKNERVQKIQIYHKDIKEEIYDR